MSNTSIEFKDFQQALATVTAAWKVSDWDLARQGLVYICNEIPTEYLEKMLLTDIEAVMGTSALLIKVGFHDADEGTPERRLFDAVFKYIFENMTPEIKEKMGKALCQELYNLRGDVLFSNATIQ